MQFLPTRYRNWGGAGKKDTAAQKFWIIVWDCVCDGGTVQRMKDYSKITQCPVHTRGPRGLPLTKTLQQEESDKDNLNWSLSGYFLIKSGSRDKAQRNDDLSRNSCRGHGKDKVRVVCYMTDLGANLSNKSEHGRMKASVFVPLVSVFDPTWTCGPASFYFNHAFWEVWGMWLQKSLTSMSISYITLTKVPQQIRQCLVSIVIK